MDGQRENELSYWMQMHKSIPSSSLERFPPHLFQQSSRQLQFDQMYHRMIVGRGSLMLFATIDLVAQPQQNVLDPKRKRVPEKLETTSVKPNEDRETASSCSNFNNKKQKCKVELDQLRIKSVNGFRWAPTQRRINRGSVLQSTVVKALNFHLRFVTMERSQYEMHGVTSSLEGNVGNEETLQQLQYCGIVFANRTRSARLCHSDVGPNNSKRYSIL